jgi:1-phosphatidylinositol-3-phosphate 5-kinase
MASSSVSKPSIGSPVPGPANSSSAFDNRRDSIRSISAASTTTVDRDQIIHTLDEIHSSASQSDSLTTFNDFAPLPDPTQPAEGKPAPGELVHQGLSGLYTRLREAVGVGSSSKPAQEEYTAGGNSNGKHVEVAETPAHENLYDSASGQADYSDMETPTPLASHQLSTSDLASGAVTPTGLAPGGFAPSSASGPRPSHSSQSSRGTGISLLSANKSQNASRPSLPKTPTSSAPANQARRQCQHI